MIDRDQPIVAAAVLGLAFCPLSDAAWRVADAAVDAELRAGSDLSIAVRPTADSVESWGYRLLSQPGVAASTRASFDQRNE